MKYNTVYSIIIIISLSITLLASYIVKFNIISNPQYSLHYIKERKDIVIFIPMYSESKFSIEKTLESVVRNDYPIENKIIYMVVDGKIKGKKNDDFTSNYIKDVLNINANENISTSLNYELYTGFYKYTKYILFIKTENKGKKNSFLTVVKTLYYNEFFYKREMKKTNGQVSIFIENFNDKKEEFDYINIIDELRFNNVILDNVEFLLMLDTDTIIKADGITILADYLESNPYTYAVCGETSLNNWNHNFLTMAQYFEYFITHYTLKSLESVFGDVCVLSGCFSLYRINVLINQDLIRQYENENDSSLYTANLTKIGEDRLLTNLLMTYYPRLNCKYIQNAICYTDAPISYKTLLSQRRRWTNSLLFCHIMLMLNIPKYNFLKRLRFRIIIIFELFIVLFMPILLSIGYYNFGKYIYKLATTGFDAGFNEIHFVSSIILFFFPVIYSLLLFNFKMIPHALVFIFYIPFFSILVPLYSLWYSDDISWGHTRKIEIKE